MIHLLYHGMAFFASPVSIFFKKSGRHADGIRTADAAQRAKSVKKARGS
jgi:hypothetical protein